MDNGLQWVKDPIRTESGFQQVHGGLHGLLKPIRCNSEAHRKRHRCNVGSHLGCHFIGGESVRAYFHRLSRARRIDGNDGSDRAETRGLELARGIPEPKLGPPQRHTDIAARA